MPRYSPLSRPSLQFSCCAASTRPPILTSARPPTSAAVCSACCRRPMSAASASTCAIASLPSSTRSPHPTSNPDSCSTNFCVPFFRRPTKNAFGCGPRPSVTTRLGRVSGKNLYYGPFYSRVAAKKFLNDGLDFFKMRRCVEDLHPDPSFPGCVYSEMKMCLAPCFKGCTDDEYRAEVAHVQAFLDSSGESLTRELMEQRERTSAELAFEEAAAIHAKLEKLKPVLAQL